MIYGIQKDATGNIIGAVRLDDDDAGLPDGFVSCADTDFEAAKSDLWNTLALQAQRQLQEWQGRATMLVAMGQTFSDAQKAYLSALQAIASGADTASTTLPTAPTS